MKKLNNWHSVYRHIAELLNEFYLTYQSKSPAELYKKLANSDFGNSNSRLFNFDLYENHKGLDPIQVFCTFNYSRISNESRVNNLRLLLAALDSKAEISLDIDFAGIPAPVITRVIQYRGVNFQNEIWVEFNKIFEKGLAGINQKTFNSFRNWKGIDIPSFTMFLFWMDSEQFLPLDQNTVTFLKSYNLVSTRPQTYSEYKTSIQSIKTIGYKSNNDTDTLRLIVKDAYNFSDKKTTEYVISGSTASVISSVNRLPNSIIEIQKQATQKRKELFKNFEIIAIRPKAKEKRRDESDKQKHLKNLLEGQLYQLYEAYVFSEDNDEIIKYDKSKEVDIFDVNGLNVSISAIVGKNGSGKSTLIELLYLIVNKIAYGKKMESDLKLIDEEIFADLFFKSDKVYKVSVGDKTKLFEYEFDDEQQLYKQVTKEQECEKKFHDFDIECFCYSLVINYSLYGLNAKMIGDWINPLFHKNDSYQVPIVLNPKRDDGIINVNIEDGLAKSRLLSNLLEPGLIDFDKKEIPELVPGAVPFKLDFVLDDEKIRRKRQVYEKINGRKISKRDVNKVIKYYDLNVSDSVEFPDQAKEYIYLKTITIAHNYPKFNKKYKSVVKQLNDKKKLVEYIGLLKEEESHITFKLRQAINYLQYGLYNTEGNNLVLSLSAEIEKLKISNTSDEELRTIDLIPPPFLKTNVVFQHGGDFNSLSSGEKQQVFSINTIVYHLYNIKSVMVYNGIYKYNCVNIVFDEVELYFHPDMQRTYVNNLLKRIGTLGLNVDNDINNINIIFVTHSPFILSDIPKSNVLRLAVNKEGLSNPSVPEKNTFAANVHELLADSFFLSSSIGEFAKNKINEIIAFYLRVKNARIPKELLSLQREYENLKELYAKILDNIGEDVVYGLIKNHIEFIEEQLMEVNTKITL
jgi:hypothetical protein